MNAVTKGEMPVINPEKLMPGLWSFPIVLPDNPLKWLNCYVIKGHEGERSLLIDTGFDREECHAALQEGMAQLDIRPEETEQSRTRTGIPQEQETPAERRTRIYSGV